MAAIGVRDALHAVGQPDPDRLGLVDLQPSNNTHRLNRRGPTLSGTSRQVSRVDPYALLHVSGVARDTARGPPAPPSSTRVAIAGGHLAFAPMSHRKNAPAARRRNRLPGMSLGSPESLSRFGRDLSPHATVLT